jgi:hypothetical protein
MTDKRPVHRYLYVLYKHDNPDDAFILMSFDVLNGKLNDGQALAECLETFGREYPQATLYRYRESGKDLTREKRIGRIVT